MAIIQGRKPAPGIGGGVSQVTGTLFNAALLAGLPILEYRTHTRPVHYLKMRSGNRNKSVDGTI